MLVVQLTVLLTLILFIQNLLLILLDNLEVVQASLLMVVQVALLDCLGQLLVVFYCLKFEVQLLLIQVEVGGKQQD